MMAAQQQAIIVQDEKSTKTYEEKAELDHVKPGILENADYTGAEAKTDPAEIALVRKIDWRLMVSVFEAKVPESATDWKSSQRYV
jgi:hypothetical protein